MRARLIIIDRVRGQNPPQMPFAKDQDVIQAVAPKRPDQAFNIGVLPGRPRRDRAVPYPHSPDPIFESLPVGTVIVAHQIARAPYPREMPPPSTAPAIRRSGAA